MGIIHWPYTSIERRHCRCHLLRCWYWSRRSSHIHRFKHAIWSSRVRNDSPKAYLASKLLQVSRRSILQEGTSLAFASQREEGWATWKLYLDIKEDHIGSKSKILTLYCLLPIQWTTLSISTAVLKASPYLHVVLKSRYKIYCISSVKLAS